MMGELALHIRNEGQLLSALNFALFLSIFGLQFAVLSDPYIKKSHRRLLFLASLLSFFLVVQSQLDMYLGVNRISHMGRTIVAILGYQIRPLILAVFIKITDWEKNKVIWCLVGINALVYFTALFSGLSFSITEDFSFARGPLGYCCHVVSFVLLLYLLGQSMHRFGMIRSLETGIPLGITCIVIGAVYADFLYADSSWISYLTVAVVGSCSFYYLWLHLQFAREHERALLAEQRIQILIAQVQPHFLYSALPTIQELCKHSPEKASAVTEKFHGFLDKNAAFLNKTEMVPFQKELKLTENYLELENTYFSNVRMEWDIREKNFMVPALSLQPMVENAIRHGACKREQGVIRISASREEDNYEVVIWDNGEGFQVSKAGSGIEAHIGIRDVRERMEKMCGGELEIESFQGEGTLVTMRFPVRKCQVTKEQ